MSSRSYIRRTKGECLLLGDFSVETLVNSDGVSIWTTRSGTAGIPVLLFNGGAGCCDYLEPVANLIDDISQVIRFEQRGCGRSDSEPPYDMKPVSLIWKRFESITASIDGSSVGIRGGQTWL